MTKFFIAQDEDAEYMTKKLIEECQRRGLNVKILKTEYINVGSDIPTMKFKHNIEIRAIDRLSTEDPSVQTM
jgi:hypothetical protein